MHDSLVEAKSIIGWECRENGTNWVVYGDRLIHQRQERPGNATVLNRSCETELLAPDEERHCYTT